MPISPATPLPWTAHEGWDDDWTICFQTSDAPEVTQLALATRWPQAKDDAAYIVHAANAYPVLVEALRQIAKPALGGKMQQYAARAVLKEIGER